MEFYLDFFDLVGQYLLRVIKDFGRVGECMMHSMLRS